METEEHELVDEPPPAAQVRVQICLLCLVSLHFTHTHTEPNMHTRANTHASTQTSLHTHARTHARMHARRTAQVCVLLNGEIVHSQPLKVQRLGLRG